MPKKYASPQEFIKRRTLVDDLTTIGALVAAGLAIVLIVLTFVTKQARADNQMFMATALICLDAPYLKDCQQVASPLNPFFSLDACKADIQTFHESMKDASGINSKFKNREEVGIFEWAVACIDSNGVAHAELTGTVKVGGRAL